jgi:hypothetical protein
MNIRRRIQGALLEPSQSTLPFLQEALAWAKAQPVEVEPQPDEEGENYDAEWNRRAVVMTAALVARDCEGADREDALTWARPILLTTSARNDREYFGNDQIEHNTTACAALAYGVDRNFWAEKNIGSRVCAWLDSTLTRDATARAVLVDGADELLKSLDVLVQSGVAQARILEEKITNPDAGRKAG